MAPTAMAGSGFSNSMYTRYCCVCGTSPGALLFGGWTDRKSTRLNSSHTEIYTLSLHDALPIYGPNRDGRVGLLELDVHQVLLRLRHQPGRLVVRRVDRSEEHTSELQSHRDLHSVPTRRSSDLWPQPRWPGRASRTRCTPGTAASAAPARAPCCSAGG